MKIALTFVLSFLFLMTLACGSTPQSPAGADVRGKWNVALTEQGQSSPTYTFGLNLTKNAATISGTDIPYTNGETVNTGCLNYDDLLVTGNTNGGSLITLSLSDASSHSTLTFSGTASSDGTEINGTFQGKFGENGSSPACPGTNGSAVFTRQ